MTILLEITDLYRLISKYFIFFIYSDRKFLTCIGQVFSSGQSDRFGYARSETVCNSVLLLVTKSFTF